MRCMVLLIRCDALYGSIDKPERYHLFRIAIVEMQLVFNRYSKLLRMNAPSG